MAILQLIAEEEKSLCFDFLEEKIREESRKLIESIYADEVNQFLEKMASIVDGKGNRVVVRNGYHKSRVVQTACGNVEVKLPRVDDRKATEKFVSKILPPFVRKTPTVETLIAALYLAEVSSWTWNSGGSQRLQNLQSVTARWASRMLLMKSEDR